MSEDAIKQLNNGYDLDGGGYTFERPPEGLQGLGCYVWDSPDVDCVPWVRDAVDYWKHSLHVYAFAPQDGHFPETKWPEKYTEDEWTRKLVAHGRLTTTDRSCHCHGYWAQDPDDAHKQAWNFTGNTKDDPWPNCDRCDGDGYVVSQGGEWALYTLADEDAYDAEAE